MTESLSPLATPTATRAVLERHGLATKHALGQNFLVNDSVLQRIIRLAEVGANDDVLEVGPGIGTLTIPLLKHARSVTSVERDTDLPAVLAETCAPWASHFTLIQKDALNLQPDDMPCAPTKFVANLPYAVAATLVLDYFQRFCSITRATVMVQAEVAARMQARPGNKAYGAYTVKLGLYAHPAGSFSVSPGNFFPPPHVQSTVLRLDRTPLAEGVTEQVRLATCIMADAAFATRRKTIANSMRTYFSGTVATEAIPDVLATAGINPTRRGETLTQVEFIELGKAALAAGMVA